MDDPAMSFIHKNIYVFVAKPSKQKCVLRIFWIMFLLRNLSKHPFLFMF